MRSSSGRGSLPFLPEINATRRPSGSSIPPSIKSSLVTIGVAKGEFGLLNGARGRIGQHHAPAGAAIEARQKPGEIGMCGRRGKYEPSDEPEDGRRGAILRQKAEFAMGVTKRRNTGLHGNT